MIGRRVVFVAAVVAVAAALPAATGASSGKASRLPAPLVGSWTRTFTAADWKRAGATDYAGFLGPYTLVIKASGYAQVAGAAAKLTSLPGGRLAIGQVYDCGPGIGGTYHWRVAARRLTLTKIKDICPDEVGLFTGVWKKT